MKNSIFNPGALPESFGRTRMPGMTTPKNILIIETSGRIGSVALARGEELLAVKRFSDKLRHGKEMMPTVAALCRQGEMEPGISM